ncbi:MAG: TMEM175 family protein [Nitrososphaeraceae archaeon]
MDERISKNRLEALTEGVFAIVMTLLVLEITVPQIISHKPDVDFYIADY